MMDQQEADEKTSSSPIPVIDLSPLFNDGSSSESDETERRRLSVARAIGRACCDTGFFAIKNHGVDPRIADDAWRLTKDFFDLPLEAKRTVSTDGAKYPYGYENCETLSRSKQTSTPPGSSSASAADDNEGQPLSPLPDLKETFAIGPADPAKSGMPGPRRFPHPNPPGFADALSAYYAEMEKLTDALLRAFALALDLPTERWFENKMDRHQCALRVINYPVTASSTKRMRASAHTDYGALTILKSGGPGLQVALGAKDDDGVKEPVTKWVDVPHLEGAFLVNLGDLMQRWTNDRWASTLHRVVAPPPDADGHVPRRQSMAFFVNINGDADVVPIETCVDAGQAAKYGLIKASEHLMKKHLASMGVDS